MSYRLKVPALVALAVSVVAPACATSAEPRQAGRSLDPGIERVELPAPTGRVVLERGTIERRLDFAARILPIDATDLIAPVRGQIATIDKAEGEVVVAGDLIATISPDLQIQNLLLRLDLARIRLDLARANGNASEPAAAAVTESETQLLGVGVDPATAADGRIEIRSPRDGQLVSTGFVGAELELGDVVASVGTDTQVAAIANLNETQFSAIADMTAALVLPAGSGTAAPLTATIELEPAEEAGTGGRVVATFVEEAPPAGSRVTVSVELQVVEDVLWLPPNAIRANGDTAFVLVDDPPNQRRLVIETGLRNEDRVEIRAVNDDIDAGLSVVLP